MSNRLPITLLQAALTIGLAWLLYRSVDIEAAWRIGSGLPWSTVVALPTLILLQIALVAVRVKLVVSAMNRHCTLLSVLRSVLIGAFVGQTPLTMVGGDLARIWSLSRASLSLRDSASAVALDRVLGLVSLLAMVIPANFWLWSRVDDVWLRQGVLICTLGAIGGLVLLLLLRFVPTAARQFRLVR